MSSRRIDYKKVSKAYDLLKVLSVNNRSFDLNKAILNYIKASEGIKRSEVEKFMNVGKTKATNLLNELVNKKYLIKVGVGKNTVYKIR